jgi:inorganic phosphate transporter, PiT family
MEFAGDLTAITVSFSILALILALGFEFVNGFHDTANAVATVIYTHSLQPTQAVLWSGCMNFLGVLNSSGAVAFGIISLLPIELVVNAGSGEGFAMVFALLISAIIWNLGTWYLGIPVSSSHTLIGSILGVGLANSIITYHSFGKGVNWGTAQKVLASLLISPLIGFAIAALLLLVAKALNKNPALFQTPEDNTLPPLWIRGLLILTCTGVSFAHGSNDGQKGMGLILLILIAILPGIYALDLSIDGATLNQLSASSQSAMVYLEKRALAEQTMTGRRATEVLLGYLLDAKANKNTFAALAKKNKEVMEKIAANTDINAILKNDRQSLRGNIYLVSKTIDKLDKKETFRNLTEKKILVTYRKQLLRIAEFIPIWVKVVVAFTLGCGTIMGWKRIVTTVGEKIGKDRMTYAQGASAEVVAMTTIFAADSLGLLVSTTHVLSSGVAGAITADGSEIQKDTVQSLMIAWVLTLPICIGLGALTFCAGLLIVQNGLRLN